MVKSDSPGEDESRLHIEDEKKSGDKIEGYRIAKSGRSSGEDTAFIRPLFLSIRFLLSQPA
jgi:hypothetical protein